MIFKFKIIALIKTKKKKDRSENTNQIRLKSNK